MRAILFLFFLSGSAAAFAHSLADNPDTLAGGLHILLSTHHLPFLIFVAAIVAVVVSARIRSGRRFK